jgi:hypothetical protein
MIILSRRKPEPESELGNDVLEIAPSTKINDLLKAYPELEEVLLATAPPFKKLKNPFLRRGVARVASIRHISSVGNVPLDELVNRLRAAVGQPVLAVSYAEEEYFGARPDWFSADSVVVTIDEDELDDKNKMTLVVIHEKAKDVAKGDIIELVTTFLPAPGIDIMNSKGYSTWSREDEGGAVRSYFLKNTD